MKLVIRSFLVLCAFFVPQTASAQIPVEAWADNATIGTVTMSRDGKRIAMLERTGRGNDYKVVTFDTDDQAGTFKRLDTGDDAFPYALYWVGNTHLVIEFALAFEAGNELTYFRRFLSFNVDTNESIQLLAPGRGKRGDVQSMVTAQLAQGSIVSLLRTDDKHILMSLQEDSVLNYYKVNVETGRRQSVFRGNNRLGGLVFDFDGEVRLAQEYDPTGPKIVYLARKKGDDEWIEIGAQDSRTRERISVLGFFDATRPNEVMISADDGGNVMNVFAVDLNNPSERELVFGVNRYDSIGAIRSANLTNNGALVGFAYAGKDRYTRYYIDDYEGGLFETIRQSFPEDNVRIERISDDQSRVLFYTSGPRNPGTYYVIIDGRAVKIAETRPDFAKSELGTMETITVKARDGLEFPAYVTIPPGKGPFPAIAMPHGGPWSRDYYGWDRWAAMLGNRGYVVVQPNFRGSTDLGKQLWLAGDREWGQKMQDDVEDAVQAVVDKGWADPERLGFFGWSYGGYSAVAAATRDNGIFNCIVAGAAVTDIKTIRGGLSGSRFLRQFQQPTIDGVNPMENVDKVSVPMLLVHGDEDYTVPVRHSRRFADRLRANGADYEYIEIKDMAHSPLNYAENIQWFPQLLEFFETKCSF